MATGNNNIKNLTQGKSIGTILLPQFQFPPVPERLAKAYPEFKDWVDKAQTNFTEWQKKSNIAINGNAS